MESLFRIRKKTEEITAVSGPLFSETSLGNFPDTEMLWECSQASPP